MNEKLRALVIEPGKEPEEKTIDAGLESLQHEVDGYIECVYPFDDDVCIICNEEGKINGLPLNRALRDEDGEIYDVIAGTFLVVGLTEDSFCSLDGGMIEKYGELFRNPEIFVSVNGKIRSFPIAG